MALFEMVKKAGRNSDAIVRQIEEKVLFGELKPNSMLPSEAEMMKQFGVSRNTVREALRMLESSGIIRILQGSRGGSMVTKLTNEFISDFLVKSFRLGGLSIESIIQLRVALEPAIVEVLAAGDVNAEMLSQLERNIVETEEIRRSGGPTGYSNMDFHVLLAMATGNPMFIIISKTINVLYYKIVPKIPQKTVRKMARVSIEYHRKILEAIKDRDPANARTLMYNHMVESIKLMQVVNLERIFRSRS